MSIFLKDFPLFPQTCVSIKGFFLGYGETWADSLNLATGRLGCLVQPSQCLRTIAYPEAHGLFAGQKPPEAALAADKTSVVSAAKKAATSDISIPSTTPVSYTHLRAHETDQ